MADSGTEPAHRATLHLSRPPSAGRRPTPSRASVASSIPRHSDADVANVKMDEAAGGVLRAVQVTAASLGSQVDRGGLTAAETLEDPQEVAKAARWRTGDSVRRMTSVLARISQVLKSFVESPAQAQQPGSVPAPVRPLPLRGHHDQPGPAAAVLHAGSVLDYSLLARALEMGSGNHVSHGGVLPSLDSINHSPLHPPSLPVNRQPRAPCRP